MVKKVSEPEVTESVESLGDAIEFLQLIWEVDHGLHSLSKRMETNLGVTGPQRLVIRIVGRRPGILAGELSETLRVHPSTLTGILQRLEKRGLITRKRDSQDLRRSRFVLTAAGRSIDKRQAGTVEAAVRRTMTKIPKGKLEAVRGALQILAQELSRPG